MNSYKLVWDDFCAWYLEMIKPEFFDGKGLPIDKITYDATILFFEKILKVLHPWMPFITEEIWHLIGERNESDCIIVASWPEQINADEQLLMNSEKVFELITQIRNFRSSKQISPKVGLKLFAKKHSKNGSQFEKHFAQFDGTLKKLANLNEIIFAEKSDNLYSVLITDAYEFSIQAEGAVDKDKERESLLKDLEYNKGFLKSVESKLANEKFVANAKPELIENEKKKQADALAKIKAIEEQMLSFTS